MYSPTLRTTYSDGPRRVPRRPFDRERSDQFFFMVSPLGEPSLDMVPSFFILPPDIPSFFIPSFMPVVVPLPIEPFSMLPLVIPGLVMLSCWAAGPVWD